MSLLDDYNAIDRAAIEAMIARGQEEHLQLDFKTISNANVNGTDDRRTIAKALSGFANSAGGIIIWGVVARQDATRDNLDVAIGSSLIDPAQLLVTRLNSLTGEASSPAVDGVLHKAVIANGTAGYVVTLVPESLSTPHMAKLGENRYYKRSGDSFRMLEHFDLEDMFGRRQRPKLHVWHEIRRQQPGSDVEIMTLNVVNVGRAIAAHLGLHITFDDGVEILGTSGGIRNISDINDGRPNASYEKTVGVLHANGIYTRIGEIHYRRTNPDANCTLTTLAFCENAAVEQEVTTLAPLPPLLGPQQSVEG